jgi:hypothetical protein
MGGLRLFLLQAEDAVSEWEEPADFCVGVFFFLDTLFYFIFGLVVDGLL